MKKTIFEEMGGTYIRRGDYLIPCLTVLEEEQRFIGVWGQRHKRYLKEHKRFVYITLLTSGRLHSYLTDIEEQVQGHFERIVEQMKQEQGITEQLKAENQMDMIIRFCLVMMKGGTTLHTISFMESFRKKSYHITCPVLNKTFGKCNNKLTPFDTFPCRSARLKIQLIFSCKIFPKLRCCPFCLIGLIEILLSFRIGDIINTPCHIGQLTLSDK